MRLCRASQGSDPHRHRVHDHGSEQGLESLFIFLDEEDGQLFDLNNDPQEAINLWNEPDHQKTRQELLDNLREWRIRSHYENANWANDWR